MLDCTPARVGGHPGPTGGLTLAANLLEILAGRTRGELFVMLAYAASGLGGAWVAHTTREPRDRRAVAKALACTAPCFVWAAAKAGAAMGGWSALSTTADIIFVVAPLGALFMVALVDDEWRAMTARPPLLAFFASCGATWLAWATAVMIYAASI